VRDEAPVRFPVDLCCRRPASQQDFMPPLKLSTGCAAVSTFEAAALHAPLELVEHDAVALLWRSGRRARPYADRRSDGREASGWPPSSIQKPVVCYGQRVNRALLQAKFRTTPPLVSNELTSDWRLAVSPFTCSI